MLDREKHLPNVDALEQLIPGDLLVTGLTETDVQGTDDPNQLRAILTVVSSDLSGTKD